MGGMHVAEQWIIQDFLMPIDKLADTVKFRHQQRLEKTTGNIVFVLAERFLHSFNIQVHMILVNLARIKNQEIIFSILLAVTFDTFPVIQETMLYLHFTSVFFKDYIEQIDVQKQINQPKELPTTGHFCILLRQSARRCNVQITPPPSHYVSV